MLERDDATLPVVALRHDDLPALQLDKEVFDTGDHGAELCLEQDRRLVVGMLQKSREEVLPLLDGDADMTPPWLTARALGFFRGLPLGRGSTTKTSAGAAWSRGVPDTGLGASSTY